MPYYVYIIRCKDGSYYTGHAKDPEKRYKVHKKGLGARYTRIHEPEQLVYIEQFVSRSQAMKRERKIKTLNHKRKHQLISETNILIDYNRSVPRRKHEHFFDME